MVNWALDSPWGVNFKFFLNFFCMKLLRALRLLDVACGKTCPWANGQSPKTKFLLPIKSWILLIFNYFFAHSCI